MNNKKLKYVGNILTIFAIVFIIKRLISMELDYSILLERRNLIFFIISSILYGVHIFMVCFSWKTIVYIITNVKVKFPTASVVLCKSNLLKYIPGNVFQYVGRNELAVKVNLKHGDVAFSTVVDIIFNIVGVFIVSIICYFPGLRLWYQNYAKSNLSTIGLLFGLLLLFSGISILVFKNQVINIIKKGSLLFKRENIGRTFACILYYMFWAVYTGGIFLLVLKQIVGIKFGCTQGIIILGAFLLSWIFGFIMPGAPGGIGIREMMLTLLLQNKIEVQPILFGIVIYRIINILGDFFGLFLAKAASIYDNRRREEK